MIETGKTVKVHYKGTLDDGTSYEVLKNIPGESELAGALGNNARALEYVELDYFWYLSYRVTGV